MAGVRYTDLYFGKSDSRNEVANNHDEFIKSFVNLNDIIGSVLSGDKFLVLGPKGTGKSCVAWYLKATEATGNHIVMIRDASTLPLEEIPRIQTGQPLGSQRTVTAWKFILLCNYIELLWKDTSSSIHLDEEIHRIVTGLREYGFVGDASGKAILNAATTTWKIPIPQVGTIWESERTQELNIFHLIPHLERWICREGDKTPALLLDGLDSIFLNDDKYNESLASLIQAAYDINAKMNHAGVRGSIVLLLRNDVFSRVSMRLPDSQKMRDDQSAQLDWRILSGAKGLTSPLVQLVNAKAAKALDEPYVDVFSYFNKDVQIGRPGAAPSWDPTFRYFLNLTRHTPRDLLRLFESIRLVQAEQSGPPPRKISDAVIREGVQRYSSDYFVGAIKNELAGFGDDEAPPEAALNALRHIGRSRFHRAKFEAALGEEMGTVNRATVNRLLTLLFFAGAIGNYVRSSSGSSYMQFYHRRDDLSIHLQGEFIMANPLAFAWSIPFGH